MSRQEKHGTFCGLILSGVLLCCPLVQSSAYGDDGTVRSHKTRAAYRNEPRVQPQLQYPADNRRLVSPMGSAAGLPPGYYQSHLGYNGPPLEYAPILAPALPYVYYVNQPLFEPPRAPEPQPVVVVNQITVNSPPPPPPVERVVYRERAPRAEPEAPRAPKPTTPQQVFFEISPADAQVKLDGRKLGTAADLGAREEPYELRPGVYILQVEHPTYKSQRLVFGVSEELVRVEVDLTSDEPSSRARVR